MCVYVSVSVREGGGGADSLVPELNKIPASQQHKSSDYSSVIASVAMRAKSKFISVR